jgi:hypothetical protein
MFQIQHITLIKIWYEFYATWGHQVNFLCFHGTQNISRNGTVITVGHKSSFQPFLNVLLSYSYTI